MTYINDTANMPRAYVKDANESALFEKELEKLKARVYMVPTKPHKALDLFPISNEASAADEVIKWREWDQAGTVVFAEDYMTEIPRSDVWAVERSIDIHSLIGGYHVSVQELRKSTQTGKDIPAKKFAAVREGFNLKMNSLAWNGDSSRNIQGFLDIASTNEYTVPVGAAGPKTFASKTADEILTDLFGMENTTIENTNEVEAPDTLLLPIAQYLLIKQKRVPDGDKNTVLNYFLDNATNITRVIAVPELKAAGAGSTDRMISFHNSEEKLSLEIPIMFEQFPEERHGFYYTVDCHARYAGFLVFRPLSICIGDGI